MNILILKVSAIGDVIHTIPSIVMLKHQLPTAKITWIVQNKVHHILQHQSFIDNLVVIPDNFFSIKNWLKTFLIIKKLRKTKWDMIIDYQGIEKTSIVLWFLKGKKIGFSKDHVRSKITSLFTHCHHDPDYKHIIQKNLSLASFTLQKLCNIRACPTIETLKISNTLLFPKSIQHTVESWIRNHTTKKYILLSPNTTWQSKHWPTSRWQELIKKIYDGHYDTILVGEHFGKQAKILKQWSIIEKIHLISTPQWDLLHIGYLIKKANFIIAPDTGLLQLADLLETTTIGLFGPTNKNSHGPFFCKKSIKACQQALCRCKNQKTHRNCLYIDEPNNCMYSISADQLYKQILETNNSYKIQSKMALVPSLLKDTSADYLQQA
jgi:heptosyltransferase I